MGDRKQVTRGALISVEAVERAMEGRLRLGRWFLKDPSPGGILLTWREKSVLSQRKARSGMSHLSFINKK